MEDNIKNIRLKFNCPVNLEDMQLVKGGRFCNSCNKVVHDFTNAKQQEFLSILAEHGGSICGRFSAEQMAPVQSNQFPWKRWVSAAMLLIGINLFNNKANAQIGKIKITKQQTKPQPETFVGGIGEDVDLPHFPGGEVEMYKFIKKNIRYNKAAKNGKVFALFTVKKNGVIADIKIVRSSDPTNSNEVIRVLKLSPKWHPGKLNGKAVDTQFALPVNFSRT